MVSGEPDVEICGIRDSRFGVQSLPHAADELVHVGEVALDPIGYYVMRCGCGRHQTTMHKTPRLPDHFRNKVAWMISLCSTQRKE
jgi:hypothetical protein